MKIRLLQENIYNRGLLLCEEVESRTFMQSSPLCPAQYITLSRSHSYSTYYTRIQPLSYLVQTMVIEDRYIIKVFLQMGVKYLEVGLLFSNFQECAIGAISNPEDIPLTKQPLMLKSSPVCPIHQANFSKKAFWLHLLPTNQILSKCHSSCADSEQYCPMLMIRFQGKIPLLPQP